jgi:hypothetical protein
VNSRGIPEWSISDCRHYHQPASLSNVNYGIETVITSHKFYYMSPGYYQDPQAIGEIKVFFADRKGRFAAVTCPFGGAATFSDPSFFDAGFFSRDDVSFLLFGCKSFLFMSGSNLMVVPDALLATQNDDNQMTLQTCLPSGISFFLSQSIGLFR